MFTLESLERNCAGLGNSPSVVTSSAVTYHIPSPLLVPLDPSTVGCENIDPKTPYWILLYFFCFWKAQAGEGGDSKQNWNNANKDLFRST